MPKDTSPILSRRGFFATSGAAALTLAAPARAESHGDTFQFEIVRTEKEWREQLSGIEYGILREGRTEPPKSSPLWEETRPGAYHCKGCDLHSYDGIWKIVLDKGWVFFEHAVPNAVLFGIDGPVPEYGGMAGGPGTVPEVHCRRCGSHLGHHVFLSRKILHCINGYALDFKPAEA
ncbi:peptide-methionine (R)-S-oxide reductase [Litoreibacter ponti]|uniref:peptide-methionine (R)-S-oxide reductase n=1 Tax=Litoreibacter ponti TaxID=1510457 RepID=A0A2T6BFZ9_9RHOB|nr:peptide-methionine (R)-S-oxide reductase [Litoreibacter ponti]PTX54971.1 peptide-methionine (R)-S-oxide reductase [Litoreibacter ponti]